MAFPKSIGKTYISCAFDLCLDQKGAYVSQCTCAAPAVPSPASSLASHAGRAGNAAASSAQSSSSWPTVTGLGDGMSTVDRCCTCARKDSETP